MLIGIRDSQAKSGKNPDETGMVGQSAPVQDGKLVTLIFIRLIVYMYVGQVSIAANYTNLKMMTWSRRNRSFIIAIANFYSQNRINPLKSVII